MRRKLLVQFYLPPSDLDELIVMQRDPRTSSRAEAFLLSWRNWGEGVYDASHEEIDERLAQLRQGEDLLTRYAVDASDLPRHDLWEWERSHPLGHIRPSYALRRWADVQAVLAPAAERLPCCTVVDPYGASSVEKLSNNLTRLGAVGTRTLIIKCNQKDDANRSPKVVLESVLKSKPGVQIERVYWPGTSCGFKATWTEGGDNWQVRVLVYPQRFHDRFIMFHEHASQHARVCAALGWGMEMLNENRRVPRWLSRVYPTDADDMLAAIEGRSALG